MSREAHVRFCESVAVKFRCATRPPVESVFHTLKTELKNHRIYKSKAEATADIFEYREVFYNRKRRHSILEYLSPVVCKEKKKVA